MDEENLDRMDLLFGQHKALPVPDEESAVARYLREVRKEATESESVMWSGRREEMHSGESAIDKKRQENEGVGGEQHTGYIEQRELSEWEEIVMAEFAQAKSEVAAGSVARSGSVAPYVPTTANQWRKYVLDSNPPGIEYFFSVLDRASVLKLVVYATKWLSMSINTNLSQWIWHLFVRLDSTLDYTESAVLRELGKKAARLAEKMTSDASDVARYTVRMITVIVGNYYGQRDLLHQEPTNDQ